MERIADAFGWPLRDPRWFGKTLVVALLLLIPVVGVVNGLGWMLAALDRLRAGDQTLPPGNLTYLGRGVRLAVVELVYGLAVVVIGGSVYASGVVILIHEGTGTASAALVAVAVGLSLVSLSLATLGSLALTFALPPIVLATVRGGIPGGLDARAIVKHSRAAGINTVIAGLMLIAAGLVGSLGAVLCLV
ncbi:MAG TPA: DUF4013 domain-containing protein, partial [Candidatus Dormibacteraeota bacterium]